MTGQIINRSVNNVTGAVEGRVTTDTQDTVLMLIGNDANKPTASTLHRLFLAIDTNILYHDSGTAWTAIITDVSVSSIDALSDVSITAVTIGSTLYWTGSNWVNLDVGASVQVLKGGTIPVWGSVLASEVTNTPAGTIIATTVQAAIDELDTEKVPVTRTVSTSEGLAGGGDLSANRTISHDLASLSEEVSPASGDWLLLEDTGDASVKKVQIGNLPGSGAGDVVGPASATDNAVARYDSTTGKLIQDSSVIIDDADNITGHTQSTDSLTAGILPEARGGTGQSTLAAAIDDVGGIGVTDLVFFIPLTDDGASAPRMLFGALQDEIAATASVNGRFLNYRLEGDVRDDGTSDLDPAAGTALPSGVSRVAIGNSTGLDMGGAVDGTGNATNDYITITGDPSATIADTSGFLAVAIFGNSSTTAATAHIFDALSGTNGIQFLITATQYQLLYRDTGATLRGFTISQDVSDGSTHIFALRDDATNADAWRDGTRDSQAATLRDGDLTFDQGTLYIGGVNGATTGIFDSTIATIMMFEGIVPEDIPSYVTSIATVQEAKFIGSRSFTSKFGSGRLYMGSDSEDYTIEALVSARSKGTMMCWFRPFFAATSATVTSDCVLFYVTTDGTDYWKLYYDVSDDDWVWETVSGGAAAVVARTTSAQTFSAGDDIHLAWTWDESTVKLYVDGVLAQSTAVPTEIGPTGEWAATFRLGNLAAANPANGVMNMVKCATSVLTATQIADEAGATRLLI